jgi:hypothetical protein
MGAGKKISVLVFLLLVVIQFIRPPRNRSAKIMPTDITKMYDMPDTLRIYFRTACYDCHSNETNYPWYSNIQPVGWVLANHIEKGKHDLNFSEFGSYSIRKQQSKLQAIANSIHDGTMPLSSYTIFHRNTRLTDDVKASIIDWANKIKDSLKLKN